MTILAGLWLMLYMTVLLVVSSVACLGIGLRRLIRRPVLQLPPVPPPFPSEQSASENIYVHAPSRSDPVETYRSEPEGIYETTLPRVNDYVKMRGAAAAAAAESRPLWASEESKDCCHSENDMEVAKYFIGVEKLQMKVTGKVEGECYISMNNLDKT